MLTTPYGVLLAAKVTLVGGMLAFGAYNARIGRWHALANDGATAGSEIALSHLRRSLAAELTLAVSITGLVAALGMISPMMM